MKSKKKTLLLAIFLGTFGAHRFYLSQVWKGIFYVLFFWTLFPTLISLIDAIIFASMSNDKFNKKYNRRVSDSLIKICSGCDKPLTFFSKSSFGVGKLKDGGRVCRHCYSKICKYDANFWKNSKTQYDKKLVRKMLSRFSRPPKSFKATKTKIKPIVNKKASNEFSYRYYSILVSYSESLFQIVHKLQANDTILEHINNAGKIDVTPREFILNCVIYDMVQVLKIVTNRNNDTTSLEVTGLVLLVGQLLPNKSEFFLSQGFDKVESYYDKRLYKGIANSIIELADVENPLQISIEKREDGRLISSTTQQNNFSFPTFLKISNNPLFEEYATVIYRFAVIISKADNFVSQSEEYSLREIYQLTHNPIPEMKNESLNISKGDENETLEDALAELNSLIGLNDVKTEINTLINFIKIQKAREESGLKSSSLSYHIVFTGNPGTGKTTVARIVAKIYRHLGILSEGKLVETDRSGLVAQYTGQTAVKVNKTVDSALNGILFIDEAYALVGENKDDFGNEAVATLIKRMEDDRDKLAIVLAGYTNEMKEFIDTNPGFKSRINRYINFPDYKPNELFDIFESMCCKLDYVLTEDAKIELRIVFEKAYSNRDKSFGNGRFVRNIFEKAMEQQANRIAKENNLTKEKLTTIEKDDIVNSVN